MDARKVGQRFSSFNAMPTKKLGNCLFKKIEIFAQPYRVNIRMGNGHEIFLTLIMTTTHVVKMSVTK